MTNMEQIKYAQWQGEYGENNRKNGYWRVIWRGKPLRRVGGYYLNGLKQGIWNELNKNFWILAQIQESGQYFQGQKNGEWIYFFDDKKIGGGSYNQSGQKNGKWIELGDVFYNHSQVTYEGEYKNGKKIGLWDIWFKKHIVGKQNYMIGGGSYDQEDQNKIGKWIELSDGFQEFCQVTCSGEYKNGKRVGQWSIWYKYWETNNNEVIGGGFYDEEGSMKIGRWIELSDEFKCDLQITINGEYNNGKRVGIWQKINIQNNKIYSQINYDK
ncbi:unnamed protein product [Paramecium primaurelia]|uniref:MORN repeat protein n=1 Tax=Paramecium primaurelia TaxID=5886 RepID=A0A8S1QQ00_PARPR|nr:unnamed protein product [Paramecium primaurelia]